MQLPARISKYELLEFLGGGMSHVYRAQDTVIGRTVAVKILTEIGAQDPEAKARFLNEARMAGNISHDNIVAVHDYGEDGGRPFMVMEFLEGHHLRNLIYDGKAGDLKDRLRILLQVARALEFVHSKKIIHRDIKPENIHVDFKGRAKLMDFGISKAENLSLTKTGTALGTPYYMAPEQILGMPVTERADIYSFGVVMYETLACKKPVSGETVERLFYSILNEPFDMQPLVANGTPEPVRNLITRLTGKKPEERVQHFREVIRELEGLIGDKPPVQVAPPPKPASKLGLVAALAAVGGLALILVIQIWRNKGEKDIVPPPKKMEATLALPAGDMILVPAGSFLAGDKKEPAALPAFYIDRNEVSNAAYSKFCEAKNRPLPPGFPSDRPNDPVTNITVVDAQEFAKWAGKRLPTALEWEKAARGTDGRKYPWGDDEEPARANVSNNPQFRGSGVQAVTEFASGASPLGALNMSGNVWEFVDELRTPSAGALARFAYALNPPPTAQEPWYVAKGASYKWELAAGAVYEWVSIPARMASPDIGFRCAKDP